MEDKIILPKGESVVFLDYTIMNSNNNDGLVLSKPFSNPFSKKGYETHLGSYGEGTKANIDFAKRDALLYYMIARPNIFATTLVRKLRKPGSGTYHEYVLLKDCLAQEGIPCPVEITSGNGMNCMIFFNGKQL